MRSKHKEQEMNTKKKKSQDSDFFARKWGTPRPFWNAINAVFLDLGCGPRMFISQSFIKLCILTS